MPSTKSPAIHEGKLRLTLTEAARGPQDRFWMDRQTMVVGSMPSVRRSFGQRSLSRKNFFDSEAKRGDFGRVRRFFWAILPIVALLGCGSSAPSGPAHAVSSGRTLRYEVQVDAALQRLSVRLCGEPAKLGEGLTAMSRVAWSVVSGVRWDSGVAWARRGDAFVPMGRAEPCLRYQVDLVRAARVSRFAQRTEHGVLLSQNLALLFPARTRSAVLRLRTPPGVYGSLPFAEENGEFRLPTSAFVQVGNLAFVRRPPLRFEASGASVEVVRFAGAFAVDDAGIEVWLRGAIAAVADVGGRFPRRRLQVLLVPIGPSARPVAFGLVRRGGGASVMFLVHSNATAEALRADWTATHEFSHLLMPPMRPEDRWVSEGLATYFQEVLRVRQGLTTEREAWQSIRSGLRRGAQSGDEVDLWQTSRERRSFFRIYWAGTAFALRADVLLHQRGSSLRELVAASQRYRADDGWGDRMSTAPHCIRHFDSLIGEPLLGPLMEQMGGTTAFPNLDALFEDLGVVGEGDALRLNDDAPLAPLRRQLMGGDEAR